MLAKWWRDKYQLPSNHELFLKSTPFDLLVELYEDRYHASPLEAYRNEKGEIQFVKTGDVLIDKWEQELAEGKLPSYLEAFTPEQLEKLNRMRTKGTDRFGKAVPSSSGTLKDTFDTVLLDGARQGLGVPPAPFQRFSDKEFPE